MQKQNKKKMPGPLGQKKLYLTQYDSLDNMNTLTETTPTDRLSLIGNTAYRQHTFRMKSPPFKQQLCNCFNILSVKSNYIKDLRIYYKCNRCYLHHNHAMSKQLLMLLDTAKFGKYNLRGLYP